MCYDFHRVYRRVLSWHNTKAPRVGLQWVPPTTPAVHISITFSFLFFGVLGHLLMCWVTSSVGTKSNGLKTTCTGNLLPFVTFDENLRLIGRQMCLQGPLLYVRDWKLGRGCGLAVMGQYTFLMLFPWTPFFCCLFVCFFFVFFFKKQIFFFLKKIYIYLFMCKSFIFVILC